ncbi:MAG: 4Fe-4S dicluster domain-containing protein [Planctomycetota bacterium]|nr:MAG: 4Fe-4S dicluster domain-containing protein [Planctomycetota bacterium]
METIVDVLGIPSFIIASFLVPIAFGCFAYSMGKWIQVLKAGQPENRLDQPEKRIAGVLSFVFFQKRLFKYPFAGLMHAFIFWGFCVLTLRALSLILAGFHFGLIHSLLSTSIGQIYLWMKDWFALLVLIFVAIALWRRLVIKPERVHKSLDALFVLTLISLIMITDFAMEGAYFNLVDDPLRNAQPVSAIVSSWMTGLSEPVLWAIFKTSFWGHVFIILFFLNYLPYSKHFHVITCVPNVYSRRLKPMGKIDTLDIEDEEAESFGVAKISDLSWKNIMDVYTCTHCGRCQDFCPAWRSGKPLSPMEVNIAVRDHVHQHREYFSQLANGEGDKEDKRNQLIPEVIHPDTFWSCTTCGYCEDACPLLIENFQRFIKMRQYKVLMEGDFPQEARTALDGMEVHGNPWGMSQGDRDKWAEGLDIPRAKDGNFEYLFWVGCAGSYDKRYQKVTQAVAQILKKAGISFAILGTEEKCTGDSARRMGNEYLFQMLAQENIETFQKYGVKKIITTCPHCLNTLANEYPDFGGDYEVIHHSQLIWDLLEQGKIEIQENNKDKVIYHDSCYLGRHNQIFEPPRKIIEKACGEVLEFGLNRKKGFCCGAGGARMWMEETLGERVNKLRLKQAELSAPDANVVGTNCPFCMTMFEDAITSTGKEEKRKALDIAEIVAQRLKK